MLDAAAPTIKHQLAVFYLAAGVWKINSSFLDPYYSCGPVFFMQLLDVYVPQSLLADPRLLVLVATAAPAMTILARTQPICRCLAGPFKGSS